MDEQSNGYQFQSPVQPQQPRPDSVVQPQQPAFQSVVQPAQPFEAQPQPQQPFAEPGYQQPYADPAYQQPFGAPTAPPPGYVPGSQPVYGQGGSYQPPASTGKATAALVCGIAAIAVCVLIPLIGAPIGIILGIVAIVLASSFIRQNGPFGRAKAGRVCGIVGLVLSILSLVLVLLAGVFAAFVGLNLYDDLGGVDAYEIIESIESIDDFNDYAPLDSDVPFAERVLSNDEQAAIDAASAKLDALIADEAALIAGVGDIANEGFFEATGLTFEECGVDAQEYVLAITQGMSYEVDDVMLYGDGTGYVGASINCKDIFAIYEDFYEDMAELASAPGAEAMSDEEYNQRAGQILMASVRDADVEQACNWAVIDVELAGSEWTVNQETWDFEMDYMFSLV